MTVTATGCRFDPYSRKEIFNIFDSIPIPGRKYLIFLFIHFFVLVFECLSSSTQHAMPPEFSGKRERSVLR